MSDLETELALLEPDDEPDALADGELSCPDCDWRSGQGGFAAARLGRHRKAEHREAWEAGRAQPKEKPAAKATTKAKATPTDRAPKAGRGVSREVEDNVKMFYGIVADISEMRGDPLAPRIRQAIPACAKEWGNLAEHNKRVAQFWTAGGGATSWVGLGMAHLPILMGIYETRIVPRQLARRLAEDQDRAADFGPEPQTVAYSPYGNGSDPEAVGDDASGPRGWAINPDGTVVAAGTGFPS